MVFITVLVSLFLNKSIVTAGSLSIYSRYVHISFLFAATIMADFSSYDEALAIVGWANA